MKKNIVLSESLEDYLEVIFELEKIHKVARVKDIAEKMGVQRGSVSGTLKSLKQKKLINYRPYSFITLTKQGKKLAEEICRRHQVIKNFLQCVLLLDESKAEENACRMEHSMDKAPSIGLFNSSTIFINVPAPEKIGSATSTPFSHRTKLRRQVAPNVWTPA